MTKPNSGVSWPYQILVVDDDVELCEVATYLTNTVLVYAATTVKNELRIMSRIDHLLDINKTGRY